MLTVLGRRTSFNVQKVTWLLDEIDLPFRHIELGGKFGGLDTPEFRMHNPHGKVPVLKDGDHVVWESHAMLRYLAAKYAADRFWSDDPAIRSPVDQWMDWSLSTLQHDFLSGVFWGYYRTPQEKRDWPTINRSIEKCTGHFRLLDTMLSDRENLLGATLSLADIVIGAHLYRYYNLDLERPALPHLDDWYERLRKRPAYLRNVMIPFYDLFGKLSF
ncbi:MAG: glutathione S-transferase [Rhizobiaceae bacterium]|nr:glutathione S-transferase [Rhizobiaceae bacterium]